MKNALLVTLMAATLGLGATAAIAGDWNGKGGERGYSKHNGGKQGKHQGKRGGRHGGERMMKRMAEKLGLTDAQQAELKTLRETQKVQSGALREKMKALRVEIQALDTTSLDYDNQVAALADKQANISRERLIQRNSARQKLDAVLTAEQRAKMKAMKEARKSRRAKRQDKS